jgi:hypothetical protein
MPIYAGEELRGHAGGGRADDAELARLAKDIAAALD